MGLHAVLASTAMRIALLLFLLGACAGHGAPGPAWPKLHAGSDDGGESLAPHVAGTGPGSAGSAASTASAADDSAATATDSTASDDTAQPADDSAGSADDATIDIDDDGP